MEKDIKDYRKKELKSFFLANILLILHGTGFVGNIVYLLGEESFWKAVGRLFDSSVLSTVLYIYIFIIDSLISEKIKDKLIWLVTGLPGNTIFTAIKENNRDKRFTTKMALSVYANLYEKLDSESDVKRASKLQNEFWYKLYQKYEKEAQVYISQRDYLLCRDMTVLMLWILIGSSLFSFVIPWEISFKVWILLCMEFFVLWISSRVKGRRFAYNVVAKDLASYGSVVEYQENYYD